MMGTGGGGGGGGGLHHAYESRAKGKPAKESEKEESNHYLNDCSLKGPAAAEARR